MIPLSRSSGFEGERGRQRRRPQQNGCEVDREKARRRHAHEVIGSFFPVDPPQFQSVPFAYRFEPIKESPVDAGFASISVTVLTSQTEVADFAMLARGLVYGTPIIDQVE